MMEDNEIIRVLTETSARAKSNTKRIDKIEERQDNLDKLAAAMATVDAEQKHIKQDVAEIKSDVKTLAGKPGKMWEGLVEKILWLIIGGAIAYFLSKLGIG